MRVFLIILSLGTILTPPALMFADCEYYEVFAEEWFYIGYEVLSEWHDSSEEGFEQFEMYMQEMMEKTRTEAENLFQYFENEYIIALGEDIIAFLDDLNRVIADAIENNDPAEFFKYCLVIAKDFMLIAYYCSVDAPEEDESQYYEENQ